MAAMASVYCATGRQPAKRVPGKPSAAEELHRPAEHFLAQTVSQMSSTMTVTSCYVDLDVFIKKGATRN